MHHPSGAFSPMEQEVWRLYEGRSAVGFGKRFGADMMWSRTAAAYSGKQIPHRVRVRALPLRTLSGTPIFHGDVVSPPGEDADRFLALGDDDAVLFARANSSRFIRREPSDSSARRDFVRHGHVLESVRLSRAFDAALRAYAVREFPSDRLAWGLSLLMLLGCFVVGAVQWTLQGGVGLLAPCLGGIASGWMFFFMWKRWFPETFRRSTTSRVADGAVWRTAVIFSASYGVVGYLGLTGGESGAAGVLAGMLAAAVVGLCFAMVAGVLAADALTRHQDRKVGMPSEIRSFLEVPSAFLQVEPQDPEEEAPDAGGSLR